MDEKTKKIAELNDFFRASQAKKIEGWDYSFAVDNHVPLELFPRLRRRVAAYADFTPDNNPHGERDSGAFDFYGERIAWKIDYYDKATLAPSHDPSDPDKTLRSLFVMLESEG